MERVLKDLANEASIPKFYTIKKACLDALDFLLSPNAKEVPAYQLRNRCLEPFQMALETRTKRLSNMAIKGIEMILQDNQFQSTMESESEEKRLPFQILRTIYTSPNLQEDAQIEIIKLLLNMSLSSAWCVNSKVIAEISQNVEKFLSSFLPFFLSSFLPFFLSSFPSFLPFLPFYLSFLSTFPSFLPFLPFYLSFLSTFPSFLPFFLSFLPSFQLFFFFYLS
ncbi:unnamed protein product [Acanthosepion pharaonis]|uniref:Mon2/Sec7/BIG1-like dimerisation and cyclophilin-binding domain-containing protein n=1 Tax=Acanthosepion pharaonis TaxID=158019 RepID=A0A812AJ20_ACAPH|nr:unnamed protein product [Sepia pharaonis]